MELHPITYGVPKSTCSVNIGPWALLLKNFSGFTGTGKTGHDIINRTIYTQGSKQINENCAYDADCASGLYCVTVTIDGSKTSRCSKCNQSFIDGT